MSNKRPKILRITTVAGTMNVILKGQLAYLNQSFDLIGATAPFFNYFDEIAEREGIKLYSVDLTRRITPIRDLGALFKLIYIILKERPDIIHTQTPKANLIGIMAGFICGTRVRMLSIVGMPVYKEVGIKGKLLKLLDLLSFRMATHIYPNSRGLFNHYSRSSIALKKLGFIGNGSSNGIDFDYYNPKAVKEDELNRVRTETSLKKEHFVFSFMGRVVNDKGILEMVDAFLSFCDLEEFTNSRLLIIGPLRDSDDPIPVKYQNVLKTHPKICHVGLQKDVRPYLMLSNAFVFPSHREGLPGSLMQAGAMELPLLASDIIGNREIIEQADGIIFPVKNKEAIATVMIEIFRNVDKRESMVNTIRNKMKQLYDQKYYWKALKEEYLKLLK
ncbi:MAG: glycosyltransferase [Saprospiraceae bacterium]|nr:glycosyltransferase [Saprospiraceae bacterium]